MARDYEKLALFACIFLFCLPVPDVLARATGLTQASLRPFSELGPCDTPTFCLMTSGCQFLTDRDESPFMLIPFRYSREHVRWLVQEFTHKLWDLMGTVLEARERWENSGWALPVPQRGLLNLYPTLTNTSTLTESSVGSHDQFLRELRWWVTSAELHVKLLSIVGHEEDIMERKLMRLSENLNVLLPVFNVRVRELPAQTVCAQTLRPSLNSDSTPGVQYKSMVLRDIHRALLRMYQVLTLCEVHEHTHGRHRVKLHCTGEQDSIFYESVPDDIEFLYHISSLLPS